LPNTGYGALSAADDAYFRRGLERATKGDRDVPLVFFCQRNCWISWNAARRALEYGYRRVAWLPDGTDGWAEAGLPLEPVAPQ
jgi:PQQ-dependent catabolism-associated CXXCW motif protein